MRRKLTVFAAMSLTAALAVPAAAFADGRISALGGKGPEGGGRARHDSGHRDRQFHGGYGHFHRSPFFYGYYGYPYWYGAYYGGYDARFLYGTPYYPYPYGYPGFRGGGDSRGEPAPGTATPVPDGAAMPGHDPGEHAPAPDPGKDA